MYLGANKYPEFSGKDKTYIRKCLNFCYKEAKMGRRFWFVVSLLLLLTIAWIFWIRNIVPSPYTENSDFLFPVLIGLLFWLYLLFEINTTMHDAVKKYMRKFQEIESD